jgi:choline transport protein
VPPSYDIPVNAVMATLFSTSLLSCIIIGSSIAFNILISVCMVSLYFSYIIVIACMLRKRILGERLLPSRFDLGKAGIFINVAALCYLSVAIVFALFPAVPNPSLIDMNWSSLIFGCFIIISMVYYYFHGRHNYDGPVEYVKKMD